MAIPKKGDRFVKKQMSDRKTKSIVPKVDKVTEEEHKRRIQALIDAGIIKC